VFFFRGGDGEKSTVIAIASGFLALDTGAAKENIIINYLIKIGVN